MGLASTDTFSNLQLYIYIYIYIQTQEGKLAAILADTNEPLAQEVFQKEG